MRLKIKFKKTRSKPNKESGCWVTFYESQNYRDKSITLTGPAAFGKLDHLPGAGDEDWGDQFDSLRTGPNAWVRVWNDEGFRDDSYLFGPGSEISALKNGDDVDSLIIYDRNPQGAKASKKTTAKKPPKKTSKKSSKKASRKASK